MIELLIFLLQLFLKTSSIFIAVITIYYIIGLVKFIYDAFNDNLGKEATRFGILLFIAFLAISIPANFMLFYIIW
jgi:hypothetical protein